MNNHLWIRNTVVGLLLGTVGSSVYAGDRFSSPVDDASFSDAERQQMLLQRLTSREPVQEVSEAKQHRPGTPGNACLERYGM